MVPDSIDRVGVIGAGATGALVGGSLSAAKYEVALVETWAEHVETINADGLRIERPDGAAVEAHPVATTDPTDVQPVDGLFVFGKSMQTNAAIDDAEPLVAAEIIAVTLRNGLTNDEGLREYCSSERVLGGVTTTGSNVEGPGHVLHTGDGETMLGGEDRDAARTVAGALTAALTELFDGSPPENRNTAWFMEQLVREAVGVVRARGIDDLSTDPIARLQEVCATTYDTMSSMLEDVLEERPTGIDQSNDAIGQYEAGVETPFNRAVTALVTGPQQSSLEG